LLLLWSEQQPRRRSQVQQLLQHQVVLVRQLLLLRPLLLLTVRHRHAGYAYSHGPIAHTPIPQMTLLHQPLPHQLAAHMASGSLTALQTSIGTSCLLHQVCRGMCQTRLGAQRGQLDLELRLHFQQLQQQQLLLLLLKKWR
jgi:hypothetical protein